MFGITYEYRTSLSNLMKNHIFKKVQFLKKNKFVNGNSSIIDIGSTPSIDEEQNIFLEKTKDNQNVTCLSNQDCRED